MEAEEGIWEGVQAIVEVHGLSYPMLAINLYDYLDCNSVEEFTTKAEIYLRNKASMMFRGIISEDYCHIINFNYEISKDTIAKWLELKKQ